MFDPNERGYRRRLLSAAYCSHMHGSEIIGGDVVISPPCTWQKRYNKGDIKIVDRIHIRVEAKIVTLSTASSGASNKHT